MHFQHICWGLRFQTPTSVSPDGTIGVDHGGQANKYPIIWSWGTLRQIVPSDFVI